MKNGKYCSSCCKHVIDLTTLSDNEIIRILEDANGRICGLVREDQIDKPMSRIEKKLLPAFPFRIIAGLFLFGTTIKVNAQEIYGIKNKTLISQAKKQHDDISTSSSLDTIACIEGKIFNNETTAPLAGVLIAIEGHSINIETDSLGKFQINIPDSLKGNDITLLISKEGYSVTDLQ